MVSKTLFSSESDEYATPQGTFDKLNAEFNFTLDPCSTDQNCKCNNHFTIEDDGLTKDWGGRQCSVIHHILKSKTGCEKATMKA